MADHDFALSGRQPHAARLSLHRLADEQRVLAVSHPFAPSNDAPTGWRAWVESLARLGPMRPVLRVTGSACTGRRVAGGIGDRHVADESHIALVADAGCWYERHAVALVKHVPCHAEVVNLQTGGW